MTAIIAFILRLLLILFAYVFVGWIAYWIFSDFRNTVRHKKSQMTHPVTLLAQIGPEQLVKQFLSKDIVIGRDPNCDFPLPDDAISLRHCKLVYKEKQWWAEDLSSTNGTYLNDALIEAPIILMDGDRLQVGHVKISLQIHNQTGVTNE